MPRVRASLRRRGFVALLTLLGCAAALTPAAQATVDFRGDFEKSGTSATGRGWSHLQYEWDRPMPETFSLVSSPVRQGRYAGKFSVRHGYSPFGWNESTELDWMPIRDQGPGSEFFYAFSTLFPTDWFPVRGWGYFAQFYTERFTVFLGGPPISFDAQGEQLRVHVWTGRSAVKGEPPRNWEYFATHLLAKSLSKGKWNDFVMRVRWAHDKTGLLEIWHRIEGQPGFRKALSLRNVPTLRWHPSYGPDKIGVIKIGLYRKSNCAVPVQLGCSGDHGVQGTSTLYHDGFSRGTSFEEVAAAAFGDARPATLRPAPAPAKKPPAKQPAPAQPAGARGSVLPVRVRGHVVDAGCIGCAVRAEGRELRSSIAGGADRVDTAYRLLSFGGSRGVAGRVSVRLALRLGTGHLPAANLAVMQLRDVRGQLVCELYVSGDDRTMRLWSPKGGLSSASINVTTGFTVPNDGSSLLDVEISVLRNKSATISVGGRVRARVGGLRAARTVRPRFLRLGIDHYDDGRDVAAITMVYRGIKVRGPR